MKPLITYKDRAAALAAARAMPRKGAPAVMLRGGWYLTRLDHVWYLKRCVGADTIECIAYQRPEYALDQVMPLP